MGKGKEDECRHRDRGGGFGERQGNRGSPETEIHGEGRVGKQRVVGGEQMKEAGGWGAGGTCWGEDDRNGADKC